MIQGGSEITEQPIIVLDAANIGWTAGNKACSGKGLIDVINYCRNHGLIPVAFLPNHYLYNPRSPSRLITNLDEVNSEVDKGVVIPVPARDDDDLYMITYAQSKNAKLVSNDLFRDYISSSEDSAAESWVKENVISYSFVIDEFFPNPKFSKYFENATTLDTPTPELEVEASPIPTEVVPSDAEKILEEISAMSDEGDVEKALGFRYYCHICGSGFKKWGHAYTHKEESGHGAYVCGECQEILPSPKKAKEHQQTTDHITLTGTWIGQHEMRVKNIPDLTLGIIQSSNNQPDEILREIVLNKPIREYNIRGVTAGANRGWPSNPKKAAQFLHEFESLRGKEITWKKCKDTIAKQIQTPKHRTNGMLQILQMIFQPGQPREGSNKSTGSWRDNVDWDLVEIDGAIFEVIRRSLMGRNTSASVEWVEEINNYLEDVKIYYARLG